MSYCWQSPARRRGREGVLSSENSLNPLGITAKRTEHGDITILQIRLRLRRLFHNLIIRYNVYLLFVIEVIAFIIALISDKVAFF